MEREKEEGERGERGGSRFTRASATFCPISFFFIQFYHKISTYCINNRIYRPLILSRIPKYNHWSAYWSFDHIKDRFSKFQNCYQGLIICPHLRIALVGVSRDRRLVLVHNSRKFIFGI